MAGDQETNFRTCQLTNSASVYLYTCVGTLSRQCSPGEKSDLMCSHVWKGQFTATRKHFIQPWSAQQIHSIGMLKSLVFISLCTNSVLLDESKLLKVLESPIKSRAAPRTLVEVVRWLLLLGAAAAEPIVLLLQTFWTKNWDETWSQWVYFFYLKSKNTAWQDPQLTCLDPHCDRGWLNNK